MKRPSIFIFLSFFNQSKAIMNNNTCVSNAPFLRLNFCPFWGHKWKTIKATTLKFSKKLLNSNLDSHYKFHKHGLSHFCATPIWTAVQIHTPHPVHFSKIRQCVTIIVQQRRIKNQIKKYGRGIMNTSYWKYTII